MVEVIELLDSDEEGDERIRIVQRHNEQDVRPVGEEGRRDGDVVITGTRAPHAEEREKERETRSRTFSALVFSSLALGRSFFKRGGVFNLGAYKFVRSGGGDGASDEGRDVLLFKGRAAHIGTATVLTGGFFHLLFFHGKTRRYRWSRNTPRYRAPETRMRDAQVL